MFHATEGIPESYNHTWHDLRCAILIKPVFRAGVKRNALIELATGLRLIVPWRALRRFRPT